MSKEPKSPGPKFTLAAEQSGNVKKAAKVGAFAHHPPANVLPVAHDANHMERPEGGDGPHNPVER